MTEPQERAALLLAQGVKLPAIAKEIATPLRTVARWKAEDPEFLHKVAEHREKFRKEAEAQRADISRRGLANQAERVFQKMRRHAQLRKVQGAIAEWFARGGPANAKSLPEYLKAIGAAAGLVCIRYKGKDGDVPEFAINTALLDGYENIEREIAIEVGEYKQKVEHSNSPAPPSERVLALAKLPPEILRAIKVQFEIQIETDASPDHVQEPQG